MDCWSSSARALMKSSKSEGMVISIVSSPCMSFAMRASFASGINLPFDNQLSTVGLLDNVFPASHSRVNFLSLSQFFISSFVGIPYDIVL